MGMENQIRMELDECGGTEGSSIRENACPGPGEGYGDKGISRENHIQIKLDARSENERLARVAVAAFLVELDPTMDTMEDVKTAVSEAVTNAIVHGYEGQCGEKPVMLSCDREGRWVTITVSDYGVGIEDLDRAMTPFFTTKPEQDRSGMGFSFMEAFMDKLEVASVPGEGTSIVMKKYIPEEDV